jgi:nitrous oxidase accessory protein NosD
MTERRIPLLLVAALLTAAVGAPAAAGGEGGGGGKGGGKHKVHVFPGRNDPLTRAIERAEAGDVLVIHRGRYHEAVEIDKDITLKGVGKRRPIIDGGCETGIVVNVLVSGVTLKRLRVQGANEGFGSLPSEVNFVGVSNGAARRMVFRDTCDAEYGVNIYRTGPIEITRSIARGFSDAGLYVGGVQTGPVLFANNETFDNNRGIIVEDCLPGTVVVTGNRVHNNDEPGTSTSPSGIDVIRTDGVDVVANQVWDNAVFGIRTYDELANESDDNRIFSNTISGSGTYDVYDESDTNCWNGTTYQSAQPPSPRQC